MADLEIALIHQIQNRVKEEGQEIEAEQEGRQEMISVTEVVIGRANMYQAESAECIPGRVA